MSSIIHFFFHLQTNMKLYHWMTTSFARHKAADEVVESITKYADTFMEVYLGKYGRQQVAKKDATINLIPLRDDTVLGFLDQAIKFLMNELPKTLKKEDVDLLSIRDDIVASLNQTKYLFTLN